MEFKPTVFVVEVNGQEYTFAAITQREMERLIEAEKEAGTDSVKLKNLNIETLANAMKRGGTETSAEEIAEKMPMPVFKALFSAFLTANGVKLEVKSKGEVPLS
jgi:hypothetical protein